MVNSSLNILIKQDDESLLKSNHYCLYYNRGNFEWVIQYRYYLLGKLDDSYHYLSNIIFY